MARRGVVVNLVQLRRLVGNPDAYALQHEDGTWEPVRKPLDDAVLAGHLSRRYTVGTYIGHVIGYQEADAWTGARTLVLDFDTGGESLEQAKGAHTALLDLGVPNTSMGIEFSGRKGHHVWVVLGEYVPNSQLRRLGRAALALAGLPSNTEVFPKQDEVRDLGNLVKLPGGIHAVTHQPNDFVGIVPMPMLAPAWAKVVAGLPEEVRARSTGPVDNRFPCISTIQQGVTEGGRNIQLFHLAAMFRRHGAEDDLVEAILHHINERGDPLDDAELESIVRSSAHSGPICGQLPQDMQDGCGDYCIRARLAGLNTRPGQVRNAQVGESVVVTLASREEDKVSFAHDDLELAKGRLRHGS
jgi:hypothetical protein